jgi:hypothetical protein
MAPGEAPRDFVTRVRSDVSVLGSAVLGVAVAALLLMVLGLGVRDLSTAVGTPLPYVHDDPDRIEWAGLAELVVYGLAGALALYGLYAFAQRMLPATARGPIGRVIGTAALVSVAVAATWVAIDDWDAAAALLAGGCACGAYRVARGLPLDEEEKDERQAR